MDAIGLVDSLHLVCIAEDPIESNSFCIGLSKVLRVATTVPMDDKKIYALTEQTKMHISCLLSVIYHDLCSDKEREEFNHECIEFVK